MAQEHWIIESRKSLERCQKRFEEQNVTQKRSLNSCPKIGAGPLSELKEWALLMAWRFCEGSRFVAVWRWDHGNLHQTPAAKLSGYLKCQLSSEGQSPDHQKLSSNARLSRQFRFQRCMSWNRIPVNRQGSKEPRKIFVTDSEEKV